MTSQLLKSSYLCYDGHWVFLFSHSKEIEMPNSVIDSLKWRYATKKFDSERKLPQEKVDLLKQAFNLTATSYGLQPLKLMIISDQKIKQRLKAASMNQQQVVQASHLLVFCIEDDINDNYIRKYFEKVEEVRETPREVLKDFEAFLIDSFDGKPKEEVSNWMTKQAYLAMGNLLTVCAMEQIDSCPMEGFDPDEYDNILGLKEKGLRSVLVMPVGYRAQDDMFASLKKVRRGVDKVVIEVPA